MDQRNPKLASTALPALMAWLFPGAAWFHHELIPDGSPVPTALDPRTTMAIWQLGNCNAPSCLFGLEERKLTRDPPHRLPAARDDIHVRVPRCARRAPGQPCRAGAHHGRELPCARARGCDPVRLGPLPRICTAQS